MLTSEEFLDWLQEDVRADLIGGEIFMHSPVNLEHAETMNRVRLYPGLLIRRAWLDADPKPRAAACLAEIARATKAARRPR